MKKFTMTVPVTIFFDWDQPIQDCAFSGDLSTLSIIRTELPTEEDLEEWLWEAKDEWEED